MASDDPTGGRGRNNHSPQPWTSGWWRARPYGSDDGSHVGFARLQIDPLGQPVARLSAWVTPGSGADAEWDTNIWLRYDSVDGVVDHVLRIGEDTIVVSSAIPTAECAAVLCDAQAMAEAEAPEPFLAACFSALVASAPDLELAPATDLRAPDIVAAVTNSPGQRFPSHSWAPVELVTYLEDLMLAEIAGMTGIAPGPE